MKVDRLRFALIGVVAAVLWATAASAFVLEVKTDAQKHRRDIGKQLGKYVFCVTKAVLKCEKGGTTSGVECNTLTGVVAGSVTTPGAQGQFDASLAQCDGKFEANKKQKTSDYDQIGCPGDCDDGADGIQRCADLNDYEANVEGTMGAAIKAQLPSLGGLVENSCVLAVGEPAGTSQAVIDCVTNDAKRLTKYAKGVFKCNELCENDYKNKKGNGGDNDDPLCLVGDPGAAQPFKDCLTKKADKQLTKLVAAQVLTKSTIDGALNQALNDLYNKDDPTTDPDTDVCSDCGNNTREGVEDCDGTDDSACSGNCNSDCTCP